MYVVINGLVYDYYPIAIKPGSNAKFILLDVSPPVIEPGILIVDKVMYDVSIQELLRRKINVNKRRQPEITKSVETSTTSQPIQYTNESESGELIGNEELQAINMAWNEQVGALLEDVYPETGDIEIAEPPQSGFSSSSNPVSHSHSDFE